MTTRPSRQISYRRRYILVGSRILLLGGTLLLSGGRAPSDPTPGRAPAAAPSPAQPGPL